MTLYRWPCRVHTEPTSKCYRVGLYRFLFGLHKEKWDDYTWLPFVLLDSTNHFWTAFDTSRCASSCILAFVCVQGDKNKRETSGPNEIVSCTNCSPNPCTHTANNGCSPEVCYSKLSMINIRSAIVLYCKKQKHPFFSQVFLKINSTEIIYLLWQF